MGIFASLFERRSVENPAVPLDSANLLASLAGGAATATGKFVSIEGALRTSSVYACIRVLAESVASMPLFLNRRLARGREHANDLPLYGLLHDSPNREMTSFELIENVMGYLNAWGYSCAEIERDGAARIRGLWPIRPNLVSVLRLDASGLPSYTGSGPRVWFVNVNGEQVPLRDSSIWHVRAFGLDNTLGLSPIGQAREAIGLALAAEEFGGRLFSNDSRPGGVLMAPGTVSPTALQRIRSSWESAQSGLSNAHRVAILEQGWTWQATGIPPEEAQFLQTRQFQREEIAGVFRVPLHMIQGAGARAQGWSTLEQQSTEFVMYSLLHWLRRIEQTINRDLLTAVERQTLYAQFNPAGLLRGDIRTRFAAYAIGRQWGWLCADDIRESEEMNPLPDHQGEIFLSPLNMAPAGDAAGALDATAPDATGAAQKGNDDGQTQSN